MTRLAVVFGKSMRLYQSLLSRQLSHHRFWRCSFPYIENVWRVPRLADWFFCMQLLFTVDFVVSELIWSTIFSLWSFSLLVMICWPSCELLSKAVSYAKSKSLTVLLPHLIPCDVSLIIFLIMKSMANKTRNGRWCTLVSRQLLDTINYYKIVRHNTTSWDAHIVISMKNSNA